MSDDGNLYLLLVAEVVVVVHFARYKGICPLSNGLWEEERAGATTDSHLPYLTSQQLVGHQAFHVKHPL